MICTVDYIVYQVKIDYRESIEDTKDVVDIGLSLTLTVSNANIEVYVDRITSSKECGRVSPRKTYIVSRF